MKMAKKCVALLMAMLLVVVALPPLGASAATVEAGQSESAYFEFSNIYGIDGEFTFSNPDLFSSISYDTSASNLAGSVVNNLCYLYGAKSVSGKVGVKFTVRSDAKPGESCTITFSYEQVLDVQGTMSDWKTESYTFTVKANEPTEPKPTEPKPTEPKPTEPKPTQPKPTQPPIKIDYTELLKQIGIAEDLTPSDYTKESWDALLKALAAGKGATDSKSQEEVDKAAKDLADAIAALVKMDYSKLLAAIEEAKKLRDGDELGQLWNSLLTALDDAAAKLTSGDQAAVDAAAENLLALIKQISEKLKEQGKVVEVIKEVEVDPKGPFCNIPIHKVWPVLFVISAILNVGFIILIVIYFVRRKKNQKDDTPLVDYDIGDDAT